MPAAQATDTRQRGRAAMGAGQLEGQRRKEASTWSRVSRGRCESRMHLLPTPTLACTGAVGLWVYQSIFDAPQAASASNAGRLLVQLHPVVRRASGRLARRLYSNVIPRLRCV